MLRLVVLLLVLLNAGYYAWSHGHLRSYGFAPAEQREPERLAQQLRPETLRVLPLEESRRPEPVAETPPPLLPSLPPPDLVLEPATPVAQAEASLSPPVQPEPKLPPPAVTQELPVCLQAGDFTEAQVPALRRALQTGLPTGSWSLQSRVVTPARWIIYMGKFPNQAAMTRKKAELERMKLRLYPIDNPALRPGLSLGRFETQLQARDRLKALEKRGVKTARVVQERPEQRLSQLRIPAADDALRARLDALKPALAGKPLRNCD